jgi:hypothetical protein
MIQPQRHKGHQDPRSDDGALHLHGVLLCVLCVFVGSSFFSGQAWAAPLRVGLAAVEITPPVGTPLGGYAARNGAASTGVADPIMARALVLDDGGGPVALVATDLIGTSPAIRQRVLEKTGLPSERLLLCASHTHSGPGAFAEGAFAALVLGKHDPRVFEQLADGIAAAVTRARERLAPGQVGVASRSLPGRSRNRRHSGGVTDPELTVLALRSGRTRGALVNYSAHGTVLDAHNLRFSADWMGETQADLERRLGKGAVALYTNGAEGDQSPAVPSSDDALSQARAFGREIAREAAALLRDLKLSHETRVKVMTRPAPLPDTPGRALLSAGPTTLIQAVAIGDALLIAVPGELIAELGLRLKRHARSLGWKYPLIVGLANDHLGYLLTEAEFGKGGYEAGVSFFGPRFGEELTGELERLVSRISGRPVAERAPGRSSPSKGGGPAARETSATEAPEALGAFLRQWFQGLPATVGTLPASARARIGIRLGGPGGGAWRLEAGEGRLQVEPEPEGGAGEPELVVTATAEDWARLVRGALNVTAAFSGGRLSLKGDLALAGRLAEWLGFRPRASGGEGSTARGGDGASGPAARNRFLDRLSMERLARVRADVEALRSARSAKNSSRLFIASSLPPSDAPSPYQDFRVVIHSHSYLSHDSRGTPEEILAGAKAAGVHAVLMTDHYTEDRRFLREALRGVREGVLFVPGTELNCGLLCFRIDRIDWPADASDREIVRRVREGGGLAFIAHPEGRTDWSLPFFAGMEIYNTHADAEDGNSVPPSELRGPEAISTWLSLLQAFRRYPREAFASMFDVPEANLARWDALNAERRVVGIAGNDSHNNVGAIVRGAEGGRLEDHDVLGKKIADLPRGVLPSFLLGGVDPAPEQTVLELRLDPYDVSFGYVSTHVLAESLTEEALLDALSRGRCYVAFDWIADPTGFRFEGRVARRGKSDRVVPMGETLHRRDRPELVVESPLDAEIRLLRDGREVARGRGRSLSHAAAEPGVYRAEVWVTIAGEPRPWIYANPIRVQ